MRLPKMLEITVGNIGLPNSFLRCNSRNFVTLHLAPRVMMQHVM